MDPRVEKLAELLVTYSLRLERGETVLIEDRGIASELDTALVREVYRVGAHPLLSLTDPRTERTLLLGLTQAQADLMAELDAGRMKRCQAYIGIRGGDNAYETADVPEEKKRLFSLHYMEPVHHRIRVPKTRWVVLRYPGPSMAQQAGMSTEAFEDFYFRVCTMDYARLSHAMDALVSRLRTTDRVRVKGVETDLVFSVKGQPVIKCDGKLNIPDGEVFTAPLRDSISGSIRFNAPSLYQGVLHENILLRFEKGRIVHAEGSQSELLNRILNTDEGARGVGEFALGVNPYITRPMKDTLFDEKIAGSLHLTPGNCYDNCPNGNHSAIHWDMVLIQTEEYGGGELWFDDELVRKEGRFVVEELRGLNPEAFVKEGEQAG